MEKKLFSVTLRRETVEFITLVVRACDQRSAGDIAETAAKHAFDGMKKKLPIQTVMGTFEEYDSMRIADVGQFADLEA